MELLEWREWLGLERPPVARLLRVSEKTLQRYELGLRIPPVTLVADLFLFSEGMVRPDHIYLPAMRRLIEGRRRAR